MKFLVAFSSPKRSAKTVDVAAQHAKALGAEIILLRVIPDPRQMGVVAQLIATERPADKARVHLAKGVEDLETRGVKATGELRTGPVAPTILTTAIELEVDLIFLGTIRGSSSFSMTPRDPVLTYLVENSPISLCIIKRDADTLAVASD
jgi:nucleotide-binding universal stress UspA family protein